MTHPRLAADSGPAISDVGASELEEANNTFISPESGIAGPERGNDGVERVNTFIGPESGIAGPERGNDGFESVSEPENVYLTTAALARSAAAAHGNPQPSSHDDRANAYQRPLSKQDDQTNLPDVVFMASDLLYNETASGLNTSGTFSTPEPPGKAQRTEKGAVAVPIRKPEAVVSESTLLH